MATTNPEIAQSFLKEFFSPLPTYPSLPPLPVTTSKNQLPMAPLTLEEVTQAVFSASPLKSLGPNTIPVLVWQKA